MEKSRKSRNPKGRGDRENCGKKEDLSTEKRREKDFHGIGSGKGKRMWKRRALPYLLVIFAVTSRTVSASLGSEARLSSILRME